MLNNSVYQSLKDEKKSFSGKEIKELDKLTLKVGDDIAIALMCIHKNGTSSYTEIDVIAALIQQFKPIQVYSFRPTPPKVIFESDYNDNIIRILPQYRLLQSKRTSNNKPKYWYIDLVIELHVKHEDTTIKIASVGFEYDGHSAHYLESGVKKSYLRDLDTFERESFIPLKISPDSWKTDSSRYIGSIENYFQKQLRIFDSLSYEKRKEMSLQHTDNPELEIINQNGVLRAVALENIY